MNSRSSIASLLAAAKVARAVASVSGALLLLFLALFSAAALAAVYDFSSSFPACSSSSGTWSKSGATYTCSSGSMSLAAGDSIVAASSITVIAESGITLAGNNTIGSVSQKVNLQTAWGDIVASNSGNKTTTFYGNLTSSSGDINLTNAQVYGSIDTLDHAVLSGGSVTGNVSGRNGVTTTKGTTIGGNVTANAGEISLSGGSVSGSVHSDCCTITTYYTDIGGSLSTTVISSNSNTVSITGGTISGQISTSGGSGISIDKATVTSGSISATGVEIEISDSTIGSSSNQVNVTGNNYVTITGSTIWGNVTAGNWASALSIDSASVIYGICTSNNNSVTTPTQYPRCATAPSPSGPDHIRVFFNDNTGALTCSPRLLDAIACKNSTCAARYPSPVSVTLGPGGTAVTIPAGGTGTPSVARTTVGTATIALAASNPAVTALRCYSGSVDNPGNLVSPCNLTFSSAGFFVSVPAHRSCVTQTLTITAAKTDDKTKTCLPAFGNGVSRNIALRFAYANPASGATPAVVPTVGNASPPATALSTSADATLAMTFTNGVATTNLRYNDAGSLSVSASYTGSAATGDSGLSMGTVAAATFVVAPASFVLSGIPAAPLTAGSPFDITVTAKNSCGATTANFGKETTAATALLTSANPKPALGNATPISQVLTGFAKGVASTQLTWNEVGTVDVTATTSAYLGSTLDVVGSQAAVGRFKPAYFDTIVTPGCGTSFTYAGLTTSAIAGQPFAVEVKAKRFGGSLNDDTTNTANYEKNAVDPAVIWSKAVTLSDANGGAGTLANTTFAATDFSAGKAKRSDVSYALAAKLSAPYTLAIRATDADTPAVSSSGHTEGSTLMRSGRLRLSNAYGPEKATLPIPLQVQYWSGSSWVINSDDTCTATSLSASNFALYPSGIATGVSAVTLSNGRGSLALATPNPQKTGYVDVAANLGAVGSGNDLSCLSATKQNSTPAGLPWLRSQNGSCASTNDRDPSARASFGIYSSESKKTVHIRELY